MMPRIKPPRLLPITIFALAGLLAMKSVELVRVAAAAVAESQAVVTTAQLRRHPRILLRRHPRSLLRRHPRKIARRRSVMARERSCSSYASVARNLILARPHWQPASR